MQRGPRDTIDISSTDLALITSKGAGVRSLDADLDRFVPAEAPPAFLIISERGQVGRVHPLVKSALVLGRSPDADIRVGDPTVSALHARFVSGGSGFEVEDLTSANGTFLRAQRVSRVRLKNGDRLKFGDVEATFVVSRESEPTVPLLVAEDERRPVHARTQLRMQVPLLPAREEAEPSLRSFLTKMMVGYRFLRRHAKVIGILAGAGGLLGMLSALVFAPPPAAFCEMKLVPDGKVNPIDTDRYGATPVQFFAAAERNFGSEDLVKSTLERIGHKDPDGGLVGAVASRLKLDNVGDHLFAGSFADTTFSPVNVPPVEFLDAHVKNYLTTEVDKTLKVITAERDFLRGQVDGVNKELERISQERVKYQETNAGSLLDGQATPSLAAMETRRAELTSQTLRLAGEVEATRQQLSAENALLQGRVQAANPYRDAVAMTSKRIEELRARGLGDEHPELKQLIEEKRRLEQMVATQISTQVSDVERRSNVAHQGLRASLASLNAQLRAARAELGEIDRQLDRARKVAVDLPRIDARLNELKTAETAAQTLHAQLFDRLKKTEIQLELERVSASSRYELTVPPRLVEPRRLKVWGLRFAIGLVAGLAIAALFIGATEVRRIIIDLARNENRTTFSRA